ncbi:hypothetical protein CIPAW_01G011200 [Carya illinoinensis]|uniref:Uncharacterized protein n=1 Tax=Carya illinoinensis TaxID=32201 RepID=A0A8T1RIJ2_CARIL|nr:hypothetical protein CIPAW_01G011200 [Carya illinoinensis]
MEFVGGESDANGQGKRVFLENAMMDLCIWY